MAREKPIIPEVIEPDSKLPSDLVALRKFAYLLDEAWPIPGTNRRAGLDPIIGLIPGVGDVIAAVLSAWIVVGALRHRVPLLRVVQMIWNILLDHVIGEIPVIGDIFDFLFEENVMNMQLLLRYRDRRRPPRSFTAIAGAAALIVVFLLAVSVAFFIALIAAALWLIHQRHAF